MSTQGSKALTDRKGRIILTSEIGRRLYAACDEDVRMKLRTMLETAHRDSMEIADGLTGLPNIQSAIMTIRGGGAGAKVIFEGGVYLQGDSVTMSGEMPETIQRKLTGGLVSDVIDHPLLRDLVCINVDSQFGQTKVDFEKTICNIHEPPSL